MSRLRIYRLAALFSLAAPFFFSSEACAQVITTVAGSTWVFRSNGKPAINSPLGEIRGMAVDPAGNVLAADLSDNIVLKIAPDGTVTQFAGNGFYDFSGDGGPATSAQLYNAQGVAVDAAGSVYIADSDSRRVRKVSPGGIITTVAGGGSAFPGDGGPATSANLGSPVAVALDAAGNLFIADRLNERVYKLTGGTITTFAGSGPAVDGGGGFSGDGGPATSALLQGPTDVALDSAGNLYIADSYNFRIRKVSPSGTITTVAGGGQGFSGQSGPALSAKLGFPTGVAVDRTGNLYIADSDGQRIHMVSPGGTLTTVAGSGPSGYNQGAFSGDGGPATSARLNSPSRVAFDASGNLYIADGTNYRIRRVNAAGTITTFAGNGLFKFAGDGGPATSASLDQPYSARPDSAGNLYISDTSNNRIRKVNASGTISTVAGNGSSGFSGDGGPATSASLNFPSGLALDAAGNLYIADSDNGRVRKLSPAGTINTVAGNGNYAFSGDGGPATIASLANPKGVAVDALGNLYIADQGNDRVRKVSGGTITTVAGGGSASPGDGFLATGVKLNSPQGVAMDATGNLFIAETGSHRIRKVTSGGIITTLAGTGVAGFSGDGGPAVNASLEGPQGVAVDGTGNVYIADSSNSRVRKVSPTTGIITMVAGGGGCCFSGDGGPATASGMYLPTDVSLDGAGNLYITNFGNDRVRKVVAGAPAFSVAPASLSFSAAAGASGVAAQQVAVTSAVAGLGWSAQASTQSGGNWLTVSPSSGSVPALITVSVSAANLVAGTTYQGTITVQSPLASPSTLAVAVTFTIDTALPAQLSVEPASFSLESPVGVNPPAQTLRISNSGAGTLNWTAQVSTTSGGNWLGVSVASGSSAAGLPATIQVIANATGLGPGVYSGAVQVEAAAISQKQTVPVTLLLSQVTQTLLVSQSGLLFTGVEGGSTVPSQQIGIVNTGRGTMNWTVSTSTLSGGAWLSVSPARGSSAANSLQIPLVDVAVDVTGLASGQYNALVRADAPGASNSPQFVTVVLNVLPRGSNPGVLVRPTGLIFAARAGSSSPGSQTVRLSTAGTAGVQFAGGLLTLSGGNWLHAQPLNLALSATDPRTIIVQPALGTLAAGTYRGALTLLFDDGSPIQTVDILFLVAAPAAAASSPGSEFQSAACAPQKLFAVYRSAGNKFAALIGFPSAIEVQVLDDCGSSVPNATVVASFSNGDPALKLTGLPDGTYTGTWRPLNPASPVTVKVRVDLPPLTPAEVQAALPQVQENAKAAFVSAGGIVNAASFVPGQASAPGSIVAVFGRNLAASTLGAPGLPLPRALGGAALTAGNLDIPLFFTSAGQVNAQLPFELAANSRQQLLVKVRPDAGSQIVTVPETITVAAASPGIFTSNSSGSGQGEIVIATTGEVAAASGSLPGRAARPANRGDSGDFVSIFATGLGDVTNRPATGSAALSNPLSETILKPTVTVGGAQARVFFSGLAPFFAGLYQVNVLVPAEAPTGDAVPVVLSIGGAASNTVTMAVR